MKTASVLAIALASLASAVPNDGPARIEARQTSSASSSATGTGSSTLPTVTTKGNAFWAGSDRFYIKGIDYQPGGSSQLVDPLADTTICQRDIAEFKKLNLNTIRVYTVDNTKNHDECMAMLAEAGIYLALDVNTPNYSLNRASPAESYNPTYLQNIFATIDAFAGYSNLLLFFSGNEVINAPNTTNTAPYVKAVTRDMKQYIGERGYRAIPVGYSAADVSQNQYLMAQYMDCGDTPSMSDFYAINNYQWCDPSSFQTAWASTVEQYKNYSLPLFFSEYGCITNTRTFQETPALYNTDMTVVFSGGLVYEYSEEGNGYGVVTISGNTVTPKGSQFSDLSSEMGQVQFPSDGGEYQANNGPQECPGQSNNWDTSPWTGSALPATPSGAANYFKNGAGNGAGLGGSGSQNAPGGSSATAASGAGSVTATFGSGASNTGGASSASASSAAFAVGHGQTDFFSVMICGAAVALSFGLGMAVL